MFTLPPKMPAFGSMSSYSQISIPHHILHHVPHKRGLGGGSD
jgi:hypothetical protein